MITDVFLLLLLLLLLGLLSLLVLLFQSVVQRGLMTRLFSSLSSLSLSLDSTQTTMCCKTNNPNDDNESETRTLLKKRRPSPSMALFTRFRPDSALFALIRFRFVLKAPLTQASPSSVRPLAPATSWIFVVSRNCLHFSFWFFCFFGFVCGLPFF